MSPMYVHVVLYQSLEQVLISTRWATDPSLLYCPQPTSVVTGGSNSVPLNMEFTQLIDLASTQYRQVVRLIRLWVSYIHCGCGGAACVEV